MPDTAENEASIPSPGSELRKQREVRGISLKEIADATKISRRYLEAIESDQHDILPAPVFTRGFVKEFARYLGLDAEEMVDRYSESIRASTESDELEDQHVSQPLPLIRVDRNVVVFGVLLLLSVVVIWWLWTSGDGTPEPETASITETVAPAIAPEVPEATKATQATDTSRSGEERPVRLSGLTLQVRVLEDTWVILHADGRTPTNEVLREGTRRRFEADEQLRFEVVGNAGGLDLTLNGVSIPPLGQGARSCATSSLTRSIFASSRTAGRSHDA